jgi:hypothetical protein
VCLMCACVCSLLGSAVERAVDLVSHDTTHAVGTHAARRSELRRKYEVALAAKAAANAAEDEQAFDRELECEEEARNALRGAIVASEAEQASVHTGFDASTAALPAVRTCAETVSTEREAWTREVEAGRTLLESAREDLRTRWVAELERQQLVIAEAAAAAEALSAEEKRVLTEDKHRIENQIVRGV